METVHVPVVTIILLLQILLESLVVFHFYLLFTFPVTHKCQKQDNKGNVRKVLNSQTHGCNSCVLILGLFCSIHVCMCVLGRACVCVPCALDKSYQLPKSHYTTATCESFPSCLFQQLSTGEGGHLLI